MLKNPFPPNLPICFACLSSESGSALFPDETAILQTLGPGRRTDFSLGRLAAHHALRKLSDHAQPVLRAKDGAPVWPDGITGSIAHSAGAALAVVASTKEMLSIGIDLELETRAVAPEIFKRVGAGESADMFGQQTSLTLFSIKEAGYKALRPLTNNSLTFADMKVQRTGDRLRSTVHGFELDIIVSRQQGFILTGVYIPAKRVS